MGEKSNTRARFIRKGGWWKVYEQISKRVSQEKKARQIFRKTNISHPLIHTPTCVCVSGGKKCSFFGKFGVLCFLEIPVLRFALLPYYRRIVISLTPQYHFHQLHRHLGISRQRAHSKQPNSNREPLVSECNSLTTKLRAL